MIKAPLEREQDEEQNGDVISTAIQWFVRLRAEDKTEVEHDHFFDWLFESKINQQAFDEILRLWDSLESVKGMQFDALSALNLLQKPTKITVALNSAG